MKFARTELDRARISHISIDEDIDVSELVEQTDRIISISPIQIIGEAFYESHSSQLIIDVDLIGDMVVPCAISLKPVDLNIDLHYTENFAFDLEMANEFEGALVENEELDLVPYLIDAIMADIPLKVVHPDLKEYPKGEGWAVYNEASYEEAKKEEIDPRLAILKEYKVE